MLLTLDSPVKPGNDGLVAHANDVGAEPGKDKGRDDRSSFPGLTGESRRAAPEPDSSGCGTGSSAIPACPASRITVRDRL